MKQKLKSKRGACKRFKVTGSGKVKISKAKRRHILTKKTTKSKRQMRSSTYLKDCDAARAKKFVLAN